MTPTRLSVSRETSASNKVWSNTGTFRPNKIPVKIAPEKRTKPRSIFFLIDKRKIRRMRIILKIEIILVFLVCPDGLDGLDGQDSRDSLEHTFLSFPRKRESRLFGYFSLLTFFLSRFNLSPFLALFIYSLFTVYCLLFILLTSFESRQSR